VHKGLPIFHADIPQAFIQSKLDRDVYITFPRGVSIAYDVFKDMQDKHPESKIGIRLLRSLYGRRQAPMLWNNHLNQVLVNAGFERSKNDTSLYVHSNSGKFVACAVFVDDSIVTGDDNEKIEELRTLFIDKFKGDNHQWEPINSFLGMDIEYNGHTLVINIGL
jgi:hypothetical protein